MSQTIVCGTYCWHVRFLIQITTAKAITEVQEHVDGMRCEHTAVCCITSTPISLKSAGSFDTVAPLFRLTKKNTVHVTCTPTGQQNADGIDVYNPLKIYTIQDEHKDTLLKAFKYEVEQVKIHFGKKAEEVSQNEMTPESKRKATDNMVFATPGWNSPTRRLKIQKTDDAAGVGILQEDGQSL